MPKTIDKDPFRVIDGCPCPKGIAPYIYLVLRGAGQTASSIDRSEAAKHILHAHGKRTQAEIHADPALAAISNPSGQSQHERLSDGRANAGPVGRQLEEWEQGVDSGTNDEMSQHKIEMSAVKLGWSVRHPYSKGAEGHHWCFGKKPKPRGIKQRLLIRKIRRDLPHR